MPDRPLNRRQYLQTLAGLGLGAALRPGRAGAEGPPGVESLVRYLETLARPDGGYGWAGQDRSHLTPTFAVIGCYRLLKREPPRRPQLAAFVRSHHPFHLKVLEHRLPVFDYQQLRALLWLGEEIQSYRAGVAAWTGFTDYPVRYEEHGYPPFQLQAMTLLCRELLGLPAADVSPQLVEFFIKRRRPNGSFNQTSEERGGDGHVMHTWRGLLALRALGRPLDRREETVRWLRSCQLPGGGFTYAPGAEVGGVDDIAYTQAAVRALRLLEAEPADREKATHSIRSLRNADGGFGDRAGWDSNALATWSALDALDALGMLDRLEAPAPAARPTRRRPALPDGLKVYTMQVQAPGAGSPSDAVDLAGALGIHLWGAKNSPPGWIAQAQAVADRARAPVTFFPANEEYGTHMELPGLGDYNHVSDIMAPPGSAFGASLAGPKALTWAEFKERRIAPLEKAGGRAYWQFGDNEEYARAVLDESLERGGYAAISTVHFGNPDFTNSEPWLYRYYGRLPYVALQDAHGSEPWWWSNMLAGFRTLFLAAEPTWESWLTALKNNWTAPVRHDFVSRYETWRHGMPEVLDFVMKRQEQWRWWGERPEEIRRPAAALAVLRPEDRFEAGRPEQGIALRVRCWWVTTGQAVLKEERARLARLEVDGRVAAPVLKEQKDARGRLIDRYHLHSLPDLKPGRHRATAVIERLDTGKQEMVTREFDLG